MPRKIYRRKDWPDFLVRGIGPFGPGVVLCDCNDGFKRHISKDALERDFEKVDGDNLRSDSA